MVRPAGLLYLYKQTSISMKQKNAAFVVLTERGHKLADWTDGAPTFKKLKKWVEGYSLNPKNRLIDYKVTVWDNEKRRNVCEVSPADFKRVNYVMIRADGQVFKARLFVKEAEVGRALEEIQDIHLSAPAFAGDERIKLNVSIRKVPILASRARYLAKRLETIKAAGFERLRACKAIAA